MSVDNINTFFADISATLETKDFGELRLGAAGMTSRQHRANAANFLFGKKYEEMSSAERNALFGLSLATCSAKQASRLVMVALPVMSSLDPTCIPHMEAAAKKMPKTNAGSLNDAITPVRLAAAFPDVAVVGACLMNKSLFIDINSVWEAKTLTMPSSLAFAQAYQLNLTNEMKKLASHYNVNYWMNTVRSKLEVESGPKFNFSYMSNGLMDNYEPYLLLSKLDDELKAYFKGPYDLEKLLKYHIAVQAGFFKKDKVTMKFVQESFDVVKTTSEFTKCEMDASTSAIVDQDMMPNGTKQLLSTTDAFTASKISNRSLEGVAPIQQVIMAAPAQSDQTALISALSSVMRQSQQASPQSALQNRIETLRSQYPTWSDDALKAIAERDIANQAQAGLVRRVFNSFF